MERATISNILVVVRCKDDGEIVLDKANEIARLSGAKLHVVRVVHEAFAELSVHDIEISQELKTFLLQAEETMLQELIEPLKTSGAEVESATVWHKSDWEAVLEIAADVSADLI
ncbi:MAG: universal stress protein, partial [Pseudomonadales bacterium]